jgi:hypothetical protein
MMRREGIVVAVVDAQVDRGDRHHHPARPAARPPDLLSRAVAGPLACPPGACRLRRGTPPPPRPRSATPRRRAAGCAPAARSAPAARRDTPCPSWPSTQAQGRGRRPRAAARRRRANWCHQRHLQRGQRVVFGQAFHQAQPEVRAHAGAQHLGRPQRRRALERQHLPHAEGRALRRMLPTLPASCSRSSTTWRQRVASHPGAGRSSTKPMRAGDSSALSRRTAHRAARSPPAAPLAGQRAARAWPRPLR